MTTSIEVVDALVAATTTTFQELCDVAVSPRGPVEKLAALPSADVYATIRLLREPEGLLICGFPLAVLDALVSRYLPPGTPLTREILDDAAGEFANVIAGQTKTLLKGTPNHFSLSTPKVTSSQTDLNVTCTVGSVLHFEGMCGVFWIWICIPV